MKLFTPIQVGHMTFKNRTYHLPMGDPGYSGPMALEYYRARAKGGVAAITTGGLANFDRMLHEVDLLKIFAETIHDAAPDCKVGVQALVAYGPEKVETRPLTPSGFFSPATCDSIASDFDDPAPLAITREQMKQYTEWLAEAAWKQKQAGFDFMELHATHAYIWRQFLSPMDNKREDEYGGSIENRVRWQCDTVRAIREAVGNTFGITMRLAAMEPERDGITLEDSCQAAALLQQAGVDALIISEGANYHPRGFISSCVPLNICYPRNCFSHWAARIRNFVSIPVIAVGRIVRPGEAEAILQSGQADIIGMARALIADPEWVNKTRAGEWDNIAPCLGCNVCIASAVESEENLLKCSVNPRVCHERETVCVPAPRKKRVMVVGGGPAGMETARVAAERGHDVTLFEKASRLGGLLLPAAVGHGKEELEEFLKFLVQGLTRSGVRVRVDTAVDEALVAREQPDAVVLATGSNARKPAIPGVELEQVITAPEALLGAPVGHRVLVIGGGMVGMETAEFLANQGKRVHLVEMLDQLAADVSVLNRDATIYNVRMAGVVCIANSRPEAIGRDGVTVAVDGEERFLPVDTVVLAVGRVPENALATALAGKVAELHVIGDADGKRGFCEAMVDGHTVGREL